MRPLVSIVTPSYNQAEYLEFTMRSVLHQDYGNMEYLVVDGDSNDGSQEIIRKFADHLAWWISEPDQGQADAINKGFRRAGGEIVAWLNSDDLYLPGAVSTAVDLFEKNPEVGVVYGDAVSADSQGRLLNELRFESWGIADFLQFKIICQPAVFMRRSALERVGYLDTSYDFFLDHQLWIRLAREYKFLHQPDFWSISRYHPAAKNVTMAAESGTEVYRILQWAEKQPDLSRIVQENYRQVWSGAYAIIARYLLDGGKPKEAFLQYSKAFKMSFPSLKDYWHRYLYSGLSILGLGFLGKWYYSLKARSKPEITRDPALEDWPGIHIN
jgi:glycosyltransferase involved in cell wall biosynthesis